MNSTEKRRKELLESAQTAYRDRGFLPAVHPRYRASYTSLYGNSEGAEGLPKSTFGIRLFVCALIFALFVVMDYRGTKVLNVNSERITEEIGYEIDIRQVWKSL